MTKTGSSPRKTLLTMPDSRSTRPCPAPSLKPVDPYNYQGRPTRHSRQHALCKNLSAPLSTEKQQWQK
eukprot:6612941-Ditylum_brightwellii.AAC.1